MKFIIKLIHTILSISGFVPEHATPARVLFMGASLVFSLTVLPKYFNIDLAIAYFILSTLLYIGFIFIMLRKKGWRIQWIQKLGEEKAYLYYEGILAFAFFHNGLSLSLISQSSAGSGFWGDFSPILLMSVFISLLTTGLVVKISAALTIGVPIYYWKDMFVGRKISDFIISGPYKYTNNPMYGIGQLQVYAIAIYYNSVYGLIFGAINQALVFLFYFMVEKPFIKRTYQTKQ